MEEYVKRKNLDWGFLPQECASYFLAEDTAAGLILKAELGSGRQ